MVKPLLERYQVGFTFLVLLLLFSLKFLLYDNLGSQSFNENDVLPLAKQFTNPDWLPTDWYLNQPPGYRMLFQLIFGKFIVAWGFLPTSIMGRLLCYGLVAWGLAQIGRQLNLSLYGVVLAACLWLATGQSLVAREWMIGGLEAKAVAYGFVLLSISRLLEGRYLGMALLLGIATSFHVLVGSWAFLTVLLWLGVRWKTRLGSTVRLAWGLAIYLAASGFAIKAVWEHLFTSPTVGAVLSSYLYVFLRLPHHLNSLSWNFNWWIRPVTYLVLLGLSDRWLWKQHQSHPSAQHYRVQRGFAELALLSLVPFGMGLIVAHFDHQGTWLQFYPFRLGDVMLPLSTCFLAICALEQRLPERSHRKVMFGCTLLLSAIFSFQAVHFHQQLVDLQQFPGKEQDVTSEMKDLYVWVHDHTPKEAIVVSPPVDFESFSWSAERATIAKFKFLPQNKAAILDWYQRLSDLSGNVVTMQLINPIKDHKGRFKEALTEGYQRLTTRQAQTLMAKYQASYLVTNVGHALDFPVVYRSAHYIIYGRKD